MATQKKNITLYAHSADNTVNFYKGPLRYMTATKPYCAECGPSVTCRAGLTDGKLGRVIANKPVGSACRNGLREAIGRSLPNGVYRIELRRLATIEGR